MRLNHVESFNAFAARTVRRRGWPWLATRGSRLRPRPPCKWAVGHLQGAVAHKGRPPAGAVGCGQPARGCPRRTRMGLPLARAAGRRGGRPLAGRPAATRSAAAYAGAVLATATQEGEGEG
ncbi:hypothetical protein BHM03_00044659 [Ensete ventricosum]|nr:hypothetical protein BHM03_00044659 [Ensete ventricosum]